MGTVISLSEAKIRELLSGLEGQTASQEQINALVQDMHTAQESINAKMDLLEGVTIPDITQDIAENNIRVDDLHATVIPDLNAALDQNAAQINDLNTVVIPSLQQNLSDVSTNLNDIPKTYNQPEPPLNPDDDLRDLVVGDRWFDTDDNNKQYTWTGAEWSTLNVDIPDLSLTVNKFKTSMHMIY